MVGADFVNIDYMSQGYNIFFGNALPTTAGGRLTWGSNRTPRQSASPLVRSVQSLRYSCLSPPPGPFSRRSRPWLLRSRGRVDLGLLVLQRAHHRQERRRVQPAGRHLRAARRRLQAVLLRVVLDDDQVVPGRVVCLGEDRGRLRCRVYRGPGLSLLRLR